MNFWCFLNKVFKKRAAFDPVFQYKVEGLTKKILITRVLGDYSIITIHIISHHYVVLVARISLTPLLPLFPIIHRLWQVFWTTSCILT